MACALPTFLIGLLEEVAKKIGVITRLSNGMFSWLIGLLFKYLDCFHSSTRHRLVIGHRDYFSDIHHHRYQRLGECLHRLASMVTMISLLVIGYVAFKANDPIMASAFLIVIGAI